MTTPAAHPVPDPLSVPSAECEADIYADQARSPLQFQSR